MKYSSYVDRFERKLDKKNYKEFYTNPGTQLVKKYEYQIVDGIKQLVHCGYTDAHAYIQSFAESADINNIINRFLNGDDSVLNQRVGQFGDFTNCPTTYAELFNRVQECKNIFNDMPVDIKEKFDNSYEKFWSEFGSDYFNSVFYPDTPQDPNPESNGDVKKGEVNAE